MGYAYQPVQGDVVHETHAPPRFRGFRQYKVGTTSGALTLDQVPLSDSIFIGVTSDSQQNRQPRQDYTYQDNVDWWMLGWNGVWGRQVGLWVGVPNGKGVPGTAVGLRIYGRSNRQLVAECRVDPGLQMRCVGANGNATGGSTCTMSFRDVEDASWHEGRHRCNSKNKGGIVISGIATPGTPTGTTRPDIFRDTILSSNIGLAVGHMSRVEPGIASATWNGTGGVTWQWASVLR